MTKHHRPGLVVGFLGVVAVLITIWQGGPAIAQMKTVLVEVVNPATRPVLTRDVDQPTRIPFVETCSAESELGGVNGCELTVVPAGKILVVEMFSGSASVQDTTAKVLRSRLFVEMDVVGPRPTIQAVPVFTGTTDDSAVFVFSQITRVYVPAGAQLGAEVFVAGASSQTAFTVFGYLVDCCSIP